ncbi:hypothetical protein, partial [Bacteroides cellulosilyticus]|uniref:hypothetical protein n=1 Tax=Bacteroides cellulosilyticus TaxID=246787 RepID=UPI001E524728
PLALADPRPMSLKEKQRMTQFTLRPPFSILSIQKLVKNRFYSFPFPLFSLEGGKRKKIISNNDLTIHSL